MRPDGGDAMNCAGELDDEANLNKRDQGEGDVEKHGME